MRTSTITLYTLMLLEQYKCITALALVKQRMVANIGIGSSRPRSKGEFVAKFNKDHFDFATATARGFFLYLANPNPLASMHSISLQYAIPDKSFKYHLYEVILPETRATGE